MFSKYYIINWNFYFNLKPITKAKGVTIKGFEHFVQFKTILENWKN